MNIIGVPKTIDNDLSATDLTFGFSTAVQVATDSFDKLVTAAESPPWQRYVSQKYRISIHEQSIVQYTLQYWL